MDNPLLWICQDCAYKLQLVLVETADRTHFCDLCGELRPIAPMDDYRRIENLLGAKPEP